MDSASGALSACAGGAGGSSEGRVLGAGRDVAPGSIENVGERSALRWGRESPRARSGSTGVGVVSGWTDGGRARDVGDSAVPRLGGHMVGVSVVTAAEP